MGDDLWTAILTSWFRPWWAVTPAVLTQPVLPNWNLGTVVNVTEENSAAPQTEAAILATRSYGRQLGQISDALQVLIDERHGETNDALTKFTAMKRDVDRTKAEMLETRLCRLHDELAELHERDEATYQRLRRTLLNGLP